MAWVIRYDKVEVVYLSKEELDRSPDSEYLKKWVKEVENIEEYIIQRLKETHGITFELHGDLESIKEILKKIAVKVIDECPFANFNYSYKYFDEYKTCSLYPYVEC